MYTKRIAFSGGDVRELQAVFDGIPGVVSVQAGNILLPETENGTEIHGVELVYNPKKMDLSTLMDILFTVVNPYSPDGQGQAIGAAFRPGVWYMDAEDKPQLEFYMNFLANRGRQEQCRRCFAKALPMTDFQPLQLEQQHYYRSHPIQDTFIDITQLRRCLNY
ncbi:MAG: peptide-methionine (S)-S-oxide reductase [Anaerovibrio sp.]|nr:peptide-methionine (S)-S-oxide reductase [Anaerovibrio sp.]